MSDTTIRDAATWQLGVPTGYAQRIAHVLAIAGVNQARHTRTRLQRDDDQAREHGPAAIELFEIAVGNQIGAAEDRLEQIVWDNQWALTSALADALTWHDTSEIADQKLTELCDAFAHQWGVNIDTEQMQVGIDPDFDAIGAQSRAQAAALFARQSAAIGIIEDLPLAPEAKPVVGQALLRWRGESLDEAPTYALSSAEQRRAQLDTDLDAAGLTTDDRTRVDFVVDYLTGDTRNIDLLTSPVFVDPGEEARGRIPELLAGFDEGHVTAKQMAAEIAVMTAEDQARVREVGKAIRDGQYPDLQLWPGYADRDKLTEQLSLLAGDVEDLRATADYLAENDISNESPETWGVGDETAATIERLRERSDEIVAAATLQHGLADNGFGFRGQWQVLDDPDGRALACEQRRRLRAALGSDCVEVGIDADLHLLGVDVHAPLVGEGVAQFGQFLVRDLGGVVPGQRVGQRGGQRPLVVPHDLFQPVLGGPDLVADGDLEQFDRGGSVFAGLVVVALEPGARVAGLVDPGDGQHVGDALGVAGRHTELPGRGVADGGVGHGDCLLMGGGGFRD
ncbi:hypothetical protein A5780_38495 [Nocardia sp. 852002-20019_SCH5090214]|nr:hypothetical protein A5780_38495 [Nocardia sp. 852002-20019_SCH5090214]